MGTSSFGFACFVLLVALVMPHVAQGATPCTSSDTCAPPAVACVDGFCCDTLCDGDCAVCNGTDVGIYPQNGVCVPAPRGSSEANCGPYLCSGAHTGCDTHCDFDNNCADGFYCNNTACVPKLANGESCAAGDCTTSTGRCTCASGYCVDGVCCDSSCEGECVACTSAIKGGGLNGACGDIANRGHARPGGCAPPMPEADCVETGLCDGSGHCAYYDKGVKCLEPTCAAMIATTYACDGKGGCQPSLTTCAEGCNDAGACFDSHFCQTDEDCGGYRCENNQCKNPCQSIDDCTGNDDAGLRNVCRSDGTCGAFLANEGDAKVGGCSVSARCRVERSGGAIGLVAVMAALAACSRRRRLSPREASRPRSNCST